MVGRESKQLRMEVLDHADGATLEEVIMGTSLEGTTINTDDWNGYNGLAHMPWDHARVSHSGPVHLGPR